MAFTGPLADRMQVRELIESYADAVTRRRHSERARNRVAKAHSNFR